MLKAFKTWVDSLYQSMIFGRKVMYKGEEYFLVDDFNDGYYLGIKTKDDFPAQTYVIRIGENDIIE